MIAAVYAKPGKPCIVFQTAKSGFVNVVTQTYCGAKVPAGDGVFQVPDKTAFCDGCKDAVAKAEAAITTS